MIFKEEVCMWFKNNEPHHRLGLICGLLNMCVPLELKFIRTYLEDLGKRDDMLKDSHVRANNVKDVSHFGKVLDQRTCSKLIVYIALLEADNQPCSKIIYEKLSDCSVKLENDILANPSSSETLIAQLLLLYTMVLNHPAFTCEEKRFIGDKLTTLQQLQEQINLAQTDAWSKQPNGKENCSSVVTPTKGPCQLDQAPSQNNQNGEACDSGLSIGTEPEGEMLSDHSCVPPQQVQQSVIIPSKVINDVSREEKELSLKWAGENNGCANNMSSIGRAPLLPRVGQSSHTSANSIAPVQGAMSSSSGESLNLCSEPSSVPTTYIYNSNIVERNALNETAPANALSIKKKSGCESQFNSLKSQKVTSSQSSPISSPYVSPPHSLNPSRVASPKSTTTVTTLASVTSVKSAVVPAYPPAPATSPGKSTGRPPPPRQGSSSSSGSSHPSSPALMNNLNNTLKKPQPVNNKRFNASDRSSRMPGVTLPPNALDSVKQSSYSSTIAFFPSVDSAEESQLTLAGLSLEDSPINDSTDAVKPMNHKVPTSSAIVPTTTITTTMAMDESKAVSSTSSSKSVTKTSHSNARPSDASRNHERKDSAVIDNDGKNRGICNGHSMPPQVNGSQPVHQYNGFSQLQTNYRPPSHMFMPPPKVMPAAEPNLCAPPPLPKKATKMNAAEHRIASESKPKSSSETSPSSSLYSSPPQTPSPDINGLGNKASKKKPSDAGEDSWESAETTVVYNVPPPMVGSNGDNNTPPPQHSTYPPYINPAHQPRVNRYLPFHSHMSFLGYPPHGGLYRYPMPSPVMFGPRAPPAPPLSGSEKSSREATPPSNASGEHVSKSADVVVPPHSPSVSNGVRSRVSNSASPPNNTGVMDLPMTHAPPHAVPPAAMPYAPPNYPMYAAPYFTQYQTAYMPGHSSMSSIHSVPPSYSLPPLNSDLMYSGGYPVVNHYPPSVSNGGPNPPYASQYPMHQQGGPPPQRSKKSATCYNCGQVGHRGAECKEASMVELTRSSGTQVS